MYFIVSDINPKKDLSFNYHIKDLEDVSVKLLKPISVFLNASKCFMIPEGFISDGSSYPFNFSEALKKKEIRAAIVHDYFCKEDNQGLLNQKETHSLFRQILKEDGVGFFKRSLMFAAVRLANHRFINSNNRDWR